MAPHRTRSLNMLPSETNQHLFSWSITASCVADFSSYRVLSRVSLIITWPKNYVCRFLISYFHQLSPGIRYQLLFLFMVFVISYFLCLWYSLVTFSVHVSASFISETTPTLTPNLPTLFVHCHTIGSIYYFCLYCHSMPYSRTGCTQQYSLSFCHSVKLNYYFRYF